MRQLAKINMGTAINYNNRKFSVLKNSENGETSSEVVFVYKQVGKVVSCAYNGGEIISGHLIGLVADDGTIEMRYHQINTRGELKTGRCTSKPEIMADGKLRMHEIWQWTSGNKSSGTSMLLEV